MSLDRPLYKDEDSDTVDNYVKRMKRVPLGDGRFCVSYSTENASI